MQVCRNIYKWKYLKHLYETEQSLTQYRTEKTLTSLLCIGSPCPPHPFSIKLRCNHRSLRLLIGFLIRRLPPWPPRLVNQAPWTRPRNRRAMSRDFHSLIVQIAESRLSRAPPRHPEFVEFPWQRDAIFSQWDRMHFAMSRLKTR